MDVKEIGGKNDCWLLGVWQHFAPPPLKFNQQGYCLRSIVTVSKPILPVQYVGYLHQITVSNSIAAAVFLQDENIGILL